MIAHRRAVASRADATREQAGEQSASAWRLAAPRRFSKKSARQAVKPITDFARLGPHLTGRIGTRYAKP